MFCPSFTANNEMGMANVHAALLFFRTLTPALSRKRERERKKVGWAIVLPIIHSPTMRRAWRMPVPPCCLSCDIGYAQRVAAVIET